MTISYGATIASEVNTMSFNYDSVYRAYVQPYLRNTRQLKLTGDYATSRDGDTASQVGVPIASLLRDAIIISSRQFAYATCP